ncbi:hypothetical protein PFISCL1PPCAC_22069, partial [Pristionchus fissidentatus]
SPHSYRNHSWAAVVVPLSPLVSMLDPSILWQLLYSLPLVLAVAYATIACSRQKAPSSQVSHSEDGEELSIRSKMAGASGMGKAPDLDIYDKDGKKIKNGKKNNKKAGFGFFGIKKGDMPKKPDDVNKIADTHDPNYKTLNAVKEGQGVFGEDKAGPKAPPDGAGMAEAQDPNYKT